MKDKFLNKNGTLTAYSFLCGYIERKDLNKHGSTVTIEKDNIYHIRSSKTCKETGVTKREWVTVERLTSARKVKSLLVKLNRLSESDYILKRDGFIDKIEAICKSEYDVKKLWGTSNV